MLEERLAELNPIFFWWECELVYQYGNHQEGSSKKKPLKYKLINYH